MWIVYVQPSVQIQCSSEQSSKSLQTLFWEVFEVFVFELDSCVQDRGRRKLHVTQIRAAGSLLQLQDGHIVGRTRAENVGRDKECLLRASGWPVTTYIDLVNPNLPLGRKKSKKIIYITLVVLGKKRFYTW